MSAQLEKLRVDLTEMSPLALFSLNSCVHIKEWYLALVYIFIYFVAKECKCSPPSAETEKSISLFFFLFFMMSTYSSLKARLYPQKLSGWMEKCMYHIYRWLRDLQSDFSFQQADISFVRRCSILAAQVGCWLKWSGTEWVAGIFLGEVENEPLTFCCRCFEAGKF